MKKFPNFYFFGLASFFIASFGCHAQNKSNAAVPAEKNSQIYKCTSDPCGNTASGEDPSEVREREGSAIFREIENGNDDKYRWSVLTLYSTSTADENLRMTLVKKSKFEAVLIPPIGYLKFSAPGRIHTFKIHGKLGESNDTCPKYSIRIAEASENHAVIQKGCRKYEYAPNRFFMSVEYFLYDANTAVMRSIWHSAVHTPNAKFPQANPRPKVQVLKDGYQFDWTGLLPGDDEPTPLKIRNKFYRQDGNLICKDLTASRNDAVESGMCEGGIRERVLSK